MATDFAKGFYMRDYRQSGADMLASQLNYLLGEWRAAHWFKKLSLACQIARTVSFNLDTITERLRGGEGK